MDHFELVSEYEPTGDQPQAIEKLTKGFQDGNQFETLLGVTGSGKTFTMANIIQNLNKPTLILAHNKTLAAQLYSEFKAFFPHNAVEYFVSYYDYYQPEAYVPSTDTYIAKDSAINEEIDRLRLSATASLLERRDGLMLGICNGFQALINLGLVPYGQIQAQSADSPTLTYNTINRHISKMVYTKVVTNKSPWLQQAKLGATYCNPASHGEGRFVAPKEWLDKLFANGQVATQYVNEAGEPTMDEEWNVNGSYMAIEGITSPDGRVLGKMAHSERRGEAVAMNIYGEQDMKIFESGVAYFK